MATPLGHYREGSIGVPFSDMLAKIVKNDTEEILPLGEVGELCVSGPAVMRGYLNRPEDTAKSLRKHKDGRIWLHTGDLASQDADGFFYFKLRLKRMLKVSGVNVYPTQVEECLCTHPDVAHACVIGVPDKNQISRVKAFIILKDKSKKGDTIKEDIIKYTQSKVLKWECPREIEFRDELPKTLVGKIAFNELEKEELAKLKEAKKYPFDSD
jgi:long-chain acyl-CoA synthetase